MPFKRYIADDFTISNIIKWMIPFAIEDRTSGTEKTEIVLTHNSSAFMPPSLLNTAVLFLVFNRLDTTKQVLEAIREAKPPRLYIAADGARSSHEGEDKKVQAVRDYIMSKIDWECEVNTLFREQNLGCKIAVSGAIDWFFENEEMGIILEDDCLPSQSFFWYCEELLNKYKDSEDIYLISGDGRATKKFPLEEDYAFIKYATIWGWASWKSKWEKYDVEMKTWPYNSKPLIKRISNIKGTQRYWFNSFSAVYDNKIDTWDYQFSYLLLSDNAKCIVPKYNLIKNIGFGEDATHTYDINSTNANQETFEITFALRHPKNTDFNEKLNRFYDVHEFYLPIFLIRIINRIARLVLRKNLIA